MNLKISNIRFSALDCLINSDILKEDDNTQIIFGDQKKIYHQDSIHRIDISLDHIVIPSIKIYINTIAINLYDYEESDYLPYEEGYIIRNIDDDSDSYIECGSCLISTLKNFSCIRDINTLMCDLIVDV